MVTADELRRMALSLPEAEERETWGECTFRVREKIFIIMPPDGGTASIKATLDEQDALIALDSRTFSVAPYTGRYGWVRVNLATAHPDQLAEVVTQAWKRTAPRKLVASYTA